MLKESFKLKVLCWFTFTDLCYNSLLINDKLLGKVKSYSSFTYQLLLAF